MKKKMLSFALALAMCLSLTVPASAKDSQEATPDDISETFTIMRNGTVDEKSGAYLSEKITHLHDFLDEENAEKEVHYAVVAPTDTWTIGNTGSKALTASGDTAYYVNIWLGTYWPSDELEKVDGETVYEGGFSNWWGNRGHFVDGALESDEHGCDSVLVKPGETTTIPFSAFAQMTEGNTDCIYLLTIRALYPGASEYEDSFEGVVEQYFYFKLDPDAKSAMDKNTEKGPAVTTDTFIDVKASDYFAEAVQWAVEKNITVGTGGGYFSPNARCTNGAIIAMIWRANGSPAPAPAKLEATGAATLPNSPDSNFYYEAVQWACAEGIIPTTFNGRVECTRAVALDLLWRTTGRPAPTSPVNFNDVDPSAPYADAIAWAVEQKITSGTGGGNFSPSATCTRGQIVTFLYRAMGQ